MIDPAVLPGYLAAVLLITIAPGPDNAYIVAVAVDRGPRAGLLSAVGMSIGMVVHVTAASLGLAVLLRSAPAALDGVRLAGATYLAWLAVTTLRSTSPPSATSPSDGRAGPSGHPAAPGARRLLGRAVLTNLGNPKIILFFAAFLPQFARAGYGPAGVQFLILGLIFLLIGLAWDSAVGFSAGRLGNALTRGGRAAGALSVAAGVTFGVLAVLLALEALGTLTIG